MPWPVFFTIFGDMKAIKPLYFLTGSLTLYLTGKRENEGSMLLRLTNTCFGTWILVSGPLEPVLGRKFHVDFESAIKTHKIPSTRWENLQTKNESYKNPPRQLASGRVDHELINSLT